MNGHTWRIESVGKLCYSEKEECKAIVASFFHEFQGKLLKKEKKFIVKN